MGKSKKLTKKQRKELLGANLTRSHVPKPGFAFTDRRKEKSRKACRKANRKDSFDER